MDNSYNWFELFDRCRYLKRNFRKKFKEEKKKKGLEKKNWKLLACIEIIFLLLSWNVPGSQPIQEICCAALCWYPVGHCKQSTWSSLGWNHPLGHILQLGRFTKFWNLPTMHSLKKMKIKKRRVRIKRKNQAKSKKKLSYLAFDVVLLLLILISSHNTFKTRRWTSIHLYMSGWARLNLKAKKKIQNKKRNLGKNQ